jgi:hypothetical protein
MDCKNARLVLEVAHPLATELDSRDKKELARHLADCPECGPWAEAEHRLDDHFGKAFRAIPMPEHLPERLLARLQLDRAQWYRVRATRAVGVAAVALLVLWLVWALWLSRKPVPDWAEFGQNAVMSTAQQLEGAFGGMGVDMVAPPQFDYGLLESHGLRDFQGKQVPYLLFFSPGGKDKLPAMAEVYVLSDRQFNLDEVPHNLALAEGRKHVKFLRHPDPQHQNVVYVVVFTAGARLEIFFLPQMKAA